MKFWTFECKLVDHCLSICINNKVGASTFVPFSFYEFDLWQFFRIPTSNLTFDGNILAFSRINDIRLRDGFPNVL